MRTAFIVLLLGLAACKDGTGPGGPGPVASVEVTPVEAVFTTVGGTTQFSARPADADGVRIEDATVSWRSSNPDAVTVNQQGLATARANGTAVITAQVETVSGDAAATVCTQPLEVSIAVGGVYSAPVGCPVRIPAGANTRWRVAIARLSSAPAEANQNATLQLVTGAVAARAPALLAPVDEPAAGIRLDAAQMAILEEAAATARATAASHTRIRAGEELLLRRLGPQPTLSFPSARALVAGGPDQPRAASAPRRTFLPRSASSTSCGTVPTSATGVLVAENTDVAIYQDSALAQSGSAVTVSQAQRVLDFYSAYGKPVIQSAFGPVPDRDGNGQIVVLASNAVGGSGGGTTAAFVWGGDLLAKSACAGSNEMELVYFNPEMFRKLDQNDFQAAETLVHEVKHIVSFFQRLNGTVFSIAPSWAEEGAAEIAGEKASRRAIAARGGTLENGVINASSFPQNRFTIENYGVVLRIFNSIKYLAAQPNSVVFASGSAPYTVYGSGWHFHRFLGDAYGGAATAPNADAPFFLKQTSSATPPGVDGLPVLTGKSFAALMVEYAAAVMLNGTGAPAPARAFTTYDFPSASSVFTMTAPLGRYPHPVTATQSNGYAASVPLATGSWPGPIGNGGLRIHDFTATSATSADISVTAEQPARIVVVRLR